MGASGVGVGCWTTGGEGAALGISSPWGFSFFGNSNGFSGSGFLGIRGGGTILTLLAIPAPLLRKNKVYGHVFKFIIYSLTYRQKKVQTLTILLKIPFAFL
jgi:hypothetical protein